MVETKIIDRKTGDDGRLLATFIKKGKKYNVTTFVGTQVWEIKTFYSKPKARAYFKKVVQKF